ncbi:alanine racemase [Phytohalomonas tamaricis]|uniref:alanine racemase n=1 Tax=Phytohalomonas tamaricis TaxID=2081032 RepID=UPI000D0BB770|nr:alanine racemase [Phytohalomonas tamaricis]
MARPLHVMIDLDALRHNYRLACACAPLSQTLAVVKANAYGHGALACAQALADVAPAFAVASIEEAMVLREGGITQPIVLLEGFFDASELEVISREGLWTAVHSHWQVEALCARHLDPPVPVWVKLDSGMHRLGFEEQGIDAVWQRLQAHSGVGELHLMTHFATADMLDSAYFKRQLASVMAVRERLDAPVCLANSPATLVWPEAHGQWNRPGIMLYGADPLEGNNDMSRRLRPVMTLQSEIIAVREVASGERIGYGGRFVTSRPSRIGVVACGYGDGYDRHAVDGTPVLVDGLRAKVAGKVSMDMMTVDLTDLPQADIGSTVTLWGNGPNGTTLDVNEVAVYCDTISYTLLTGILPRVPRRYYDGHHDPQ